MILVHRIFTSYLDTNGDGSGEINAVKNYSDAEEGKTIFFKSAGKNVVLLTALIITYTGMNLDPDVYGNSSSPLINGIEIELRNTLGHSIIDFTADNLIKTNSDWYRITEHITFDTFKSLKQIMCIRFDFSSLGDVVKLEKNLIFTVTLNDDFTDLEKHTFLLYGKILDDDY